MATNELVTWATGLGANVLPNAEYGTIQERQQGVQAGIANPQTYNSALRQATFASAMIGAFSAEYSGVDTRDNGDVETFQENFIQAILNLINTPVYGVDNGTANHVIMPRVSPNITHVKFGTIVYAQISTTNTGASDIKLRGFGPFNIIRTTGAALKAGDLIAGGVAHMFFDGWQFQLLNWQDPGSVGSGGTPGAPPPAPPSNLQLAGRLPVYGTGRWIYCRFAGTHGSGSSWIGNDPVEIKIPPGVTSIRVRAGAAGGGGAAGSNPTTGTIRGGGGGEFAYGVFSVSEGQTYIARLGTPGIPGQHHRSADVLGTSGGDTTFELSGGAVLLSVRGGNAGDIGGAGGTGGSGGSFRAAGGAGSELGGGGGAGSQVGQGGAGGRGGGGVGPSGYGGPNGGGGSLWGPGDGTGPGKGGIDWTGAVGGKAAFKDGVSPAYCMDFFPGGGGSADAASFATAPHNDPTTYVPTYVIAGNGGGIGGGGGSATGYPADWSSQPSASNGGYANGGDGGCGGGGGSAEVSLGWLSAEWSLDSINFRKNPWRPGEQWIAGGGHGGVGGGGGGGGPAAGYGGPGWLIVEW